MDHGHGSSNMHDVFIQNNDEYIHIGTYVSMGLEVKSKQKASIFSSNIPFAAKHSSNPVVTQKEAACCITKIT